MKIKKQNGDKHVYEPENIRNDEIFTKRDHLIQRGMDQMKGDVCPVLQSIKASGIKDGVNQCDKTVSVLLKKTQNDHSFVLV